jgi:hypothetical protein
MISVVSSELRSSRCRVKTKPRAGSLARDCLCQTEISLARFEGSFAIEFGETLLGRLVCKFALPVVVL